jgi:4,5-DOPA dioxygenase extradiol
MGKMPAVFIGHGSPLNAIEDNDFTKTWCVIAKKIPRPTAILSISAHWFTNGTKILNDEAPKTIHDMYGFPKELYEITYNSPGAPSLAKQVKELLSRETSFDNTWGIDHGTWSVLVNMYPEHDIPVFQISIDAAAPPEVHFQIGKELKSLREQGVLLLGSGNLVHNLRMLNYSMGNKGFYWANEFNNYIVEDLSNKNYDNVINYMKLGEIAKLSVPVPDHYNPMLYILGAAYDDDKITIYNNNCILGSIAMTSFLLE